MNRLSSQATVFLSRKSFALLLVGVFLYAFTPSIASATQTSNTSWQTDSIILHEQTQEAPPPDDPGGLPGFERDAATGITRNADAGTPLGAFTYSYPFTLPPGRNGVTPDIKLTYSSQSGNDSDAFGYGWEISIPYIERYDYQGIDNLYNQGSQRFSSSLSGELASTSVSTVYVARNDDGSNFQYAFDGTSWTVQDKAGNTYLFGVATSSRQDDPNDSSHIFKWMLQQVKDANGNTTGYTYTKDSGQIYPSVITYTNVGSSGGISSGSGGSPDIFSVNFTLGLRATSTAFLNSTGFPIQTRYRVDALTTKVSGSVVRMYSFGYGTGDGGSREVLSSITESGTDERSKTTTLPATTFSYATSTRTWNDGGAILPVPFSAFGDTGSTAIADINGDGLSDIIFAQETGSGTITKAALTNTGGSWADLNNWSGAIPCVLAQYIHGLPTDMGVRLADVNGDGRADFICNRDVALNTGNGWATSTAWTMPVFTVDNGIDAGVRFMDVNHDSLLDIVQSYLYDSDLAHSVFQYVYLNNGNGWTYAPNWSIPAFFSISGDGGDIGVRITDVNGDGLDDLITGDNDNYYQNTIYLGTGTGWATSTAWVLPMSLNHTGIRILDYNDDGLPDIGDASYYYTQQGQQGWSSNFVLINTGTGWAQSSSTNPIPLPFDVNAVDAGTRIGDFDGDGTVDFIQSGQNNNPSWSANDAQFGQSPGTDIINKIREQTGSTITTIYKGSASYKDSVGNLLNSGLPVNLITLQRKDTYDGIATSTSSTYIYANGTFYVGSPFDRRLAGFGEITQTDTSGNVVNNFYHQGNSTATSSGEYSDDESKIGHVYRTETTDVDGNLYTLQINKWDDYNRGGLASFVKLIQSTLLTYDGDSDHIDKAESYAYNDTNGDLTERTEWGQVNAADDGSFTDVDTDKFVNDTTYATSTTTPLSVPDQVTTIDQASTTVRQTTNYYDTLGFGSAIKGNLTKQLQWIAGTATAETDNTYNSYGLISQTKDPRNNATNYSYDSYNLYPATTTDALGYNSTALYDYSAGKPKQTTNENGIVYKTIFDGLDRAIEQDESDPLSATSSVPKTTFVYSDDTIPRSVKETDYLNSSTSTVSYTYLDGLGRTVQHLTEAEGNHIYAATTNTYDQRGPLHSESLPYFVTTSSYTGTSSPPTSSLLTTYTYDPLGRPTAIANNLGTTTNAYDQWTVTTTDANGHSKDYLKDPYGNLTQVVEHNNDGNYTTSYQYDGNNNLIKLTDANGNIRNFTYDGLSRRLSAEDLHAATSSTFGTWTYGYDNAGNLTTENDPKNQTTNFTYDALNRSLTEDYTGAAGIEVQYGYDACLYGKLQLCTATTSDAVDTYTYTPLGMRASESAKIAGQTYTTSYAYDRLGNKTLITYPDSSQVQYLYNAAGLLDSINQKASGGTFSKLVQNFDYAPTGEVSYEQFANGITSTYTYDPNQLYRLTQILTIASSTPDGDAVVLSEQKKGVRSSTSTAHAPTTHSGGGSGTGESGTGGSSAAGPVLGTSTSSVPFATPDSAANGSAPSSQSLITKIVDTSLPSVTPLIASTSVPTKKPTVSSDTTQQAKSQLLPPTALVAIQDINYTYDAVGNITNIVDYSNTQAAHVSTFTYDYLNRLKTASTTVASSTPYSQTFTYDKTGSILNKSDIGTYSYTGANNANPQAPNTVGGSTLKYDKDGNMTKYAGNPFTWDYRNRLTSIVENGATSTYAYDFQNNRVRRMTGTSTPITTIYPNDLYNVSSSTAVRNVFTNDGTLVSTMSGTSTLTATYIHPDNQGSTNVTTDSSGTIVATDDYYPYGSQRVDVGTDQQRKFIGEEYDDDSNLSYLNARYYEGARGQFLSQDPQFWSQKETLQDPQSLNSYSYANDNPVINKDPSGKCFEDACIVETALAVGYIAVNYGPEIVEFAESLATPLGQTAIYDSAQSAQNGHPLIAVAELATAGDASVLRTTPEAARSMLQSDSALCQGVCGMSSLPSLPNISSANKAFADSFETDAGKDIASKMFRPGDQFPGGTAAALRFETQTGSFLSPAGHGIKAQNTLNQFNNALSRGILSPNDIAKLSPKLDELSSELKSFNNKFNK